MIIALLFRNSPFLFIVIRILTHKAIKIIFFHYQAISFAFYCSFILLWVFLPAKKKSRSVFYFYSTIPKNLKNIFSFHPIFIVLIYLKLKFIILRILSSINIFHYHKKMFIVLRSFTIIYFCLNEALISNFIFIYFNLK